MPANKQQQEVIDHVNGPACVMAVPGSGKTFSVTERIKALVAKGIPPHSILAITFTNKAAIEMKTRVSKAVGQTIASQMVISTFHSFCAKIIRNNAELIGLKSDYSILDSNDQEQLLKRCIDKIENKGIPDDSPKKFKPTKNYIYELFGYLEGLRNGCLTEYEAIEKYQLTANQKAVCDEYFKEMKLQNVIDFTGLLTETNRLFTEHPEIKERYRSRFKYINIDEVQDTNICQYNLIKHLGMGHGNVLVVGDQDQSLYAFRGAVPENVNSFLTEFKDVKLMKLETNYRSTPNILKYAQNVIDRNSKRIQVTLRTDNPEGADPIIESEYTDSDMAVAIASDIKAQISKGVPPKEIAVLYRINSASRVLEKAIKDVGIKYVVIGGMSFWERKEVKTAIALLRLKANPTDSLAFERVCEHCCRGVGAKTIANIISYAELNRCSLIESISQQSGNKSVSKANYLLKAIESSSGLSIGKWLTNVASLTLLKNRLEEDSDLTNDRWNTFCEVARDVEEYCSKKGATLSGYLQNLSLLTSNDDDKDESNKIKLMTMHASKGLEFECIHISHANSGIIPHSRAISGGTAEENQKSLEEERRIFYVAMTRAKKQLSMWFCKFRNFGNKNEQMHPSQFLFETGIQSDALKGEKRQQTFDE